MQWWSELNCEAAEENYLSVSKKLNIELAYDLAILLLHIYPKELKGEQTYTCTSMFIALFTIAKSGNNSNVHQLING